MDNEKILKIIESSHFNFLIGSGASRNYLDTLSNIEELLTDLENETQENKSQKWYKVLEASIKFWYYEKCIKGNTKLIDNEFELSKEKLLDFNETLNNYINFLQALNIIVLKRKNNLLPKEVNIFTTNMDLFFDKNLDKLGLEFNDGFSGKFSQTFDTSNYQKSFFKNSSQYNISSELPLFNLFKLHGSITWDKSNEKEIKYNPNCDVLKILNKITLPKEHIISLISESNNEKEIKIKHKNYSELKKEVSSKKFEDFDITLFENFVTEYDKLVMINPTKEKFENTTLRLEYYEQIRMYSNILERENSVLFVTGFSFADEHIREITRRALNSNPTLLVIVFNFNESGKKEIENLFTKLKYKNLYTEFIGYDFKKVANSVFLKIAEELDLSIRIKASEDNNSKKENIKTRLTDEEQDK
ncbi:SIR2 family protein [Cloacibacterium normanense]|jgi:hypothetical protein|uniref:SIR2-like domain protein n=1 Tax=Cloacibacterium normanense TaxID=237258 RepID=A0A1E5UGG6_9FLAO|nr:SIR2 family protein [Cloacibacterium normanense]AZI68702.1 hypothetical protein EB819_01955 [Cloacibacterium normanense]OEL11984.1 SIR2-like domain protein [Cloacibacterium normanense]SDO40277.1 SIR2-like domain-containing protein [Cloacibacterium normanense]